MSQNDFVIANDTAANVRADINDALGAIATNNSGATEPSVTYANQWWYDTSNDILKIRSEADDAWINVGYLDQSTNEFKPYVGGTQVDTQSTATWEAGTSTTEGIVSPAKVKAHLDGRFYQSSGQAITSGGSVTLAHGLGVKPKILQGYLKCLTAEGGYSTGDEVVVSIDCHRPAEITPQGISVRFDSTNIYLRYGSAGFVFVIVNNTNGDRVGLTNANWEFYAEAFS